MAETFEERINVNNKSAKDFFNQLKDIPKDVLYNKIKTKLYDVLINLNFNYMFNIEKLNPFFDSLKIVDEFILFSLSYIKFEHDLYRKLTGDEYSRHFVMTFFNDNNDAKFSYYKKSNDRMNELITKVNSEIGILKKSVIYDFDSVEIKDKLMSYIIEYDPLLVLTTIPIDEGHFYENNFFYFQGNYEFLKYNYIFQNVFKLNDYKLNKNYMIVKLSFIALAGQLQIFKSDKKK